MFFSLIKNNLKVFLISLEICVKMSTYLSPVCYYFIMITRAMLWHGCTHSLSTSAAGNHVKGEKKIIMIKLAMETGNITNAVAVGDTRGCVYWQDI